MLLALSSRMHDQGFGNIALLSSSVDGHHIYPVHFSASLRTTSPINSWVQVGCHKHLALPTSSMNSHQVKLHFLCCRTLCVTVLQCYQLYSVRALPMSCTPLLRLTHHNIFCAHCLSLQDFVRHSGSVLPALSSHGRDQGFTNILWALGCWEHVPPQHWLQDYCR